MPQDRELPDRDGQGPAHGAVGTCGHRQPLVCPHGVYGPSTVGGRGCSPRVVTAGAGVPMPRTQTPPDAPLLMGSAPRTPGWLCGPGMRGCGLGQPLAEGNRVSEAVSFLAFCCVWRKQMAMLLASGCLDNWGQHVHWLLVALRGILPASRLRPLGCRGLTPSGVTVSPDRCGQLQGLNVTGKLRLCKPSPSLSAYGV